MEGRRSDFEQAAEMARSFWLAVMDEQWEVAEQFLASEEEIEAALRTWGEVMDEPLDDAEVRQEAERTRSRLEETWEAYKTGRKKPPQGLSSRSLMEADIIVGNKMILSPGVSYIERLTLTARGVNPARARVAGAVRVGDGPWKIVWFPY